GACAHRPCAGDGAAAAGRAGVRHPLRPHGRRARPARGCGRHPHSAGCRRPVTGLTPVLDQITVQALRRRGGLKWSSAGPEVLGAFVAEMDFGTAPAVQDALRAAIDRPDFGYLATAAAPETSA